MEGRTIVVTGAASGIGAATVPALAGAGARVIAADLAWTTPRPRSATASRRVGARRERRAEDWAELAESPRGHRGRRPLDGLVNAAGITRRARLARRHRRRLRSGVRGQRRRARARHPGSLAPLMADGGSIVNVGSAAGAMAHYGIAYGASKWALRGITKTAAMELGPRGIRVNLVSPGFIETPMTSECARRVPRRERRRDAARPHRAGRRGREP